MATKSSTRSAPDTAQETVDRIRELNELIVENARKAGDTYLDLYERTLRTIADYQEELASKAPVDWVQRVLEAQAIFTREVGNVYASAARGAVKK